MKASLTSTSISIESMSTIVQMPVRVKPPPAEIGEIISPGWALRSTTTPPKGARILCLSSTVALRCDVEPRGLQVRLRLAELGTQDADPCLGLGQVGLAGNALLRQALDRPKMRSASRRSAAIAVAAASAAATACDCARLRSVSASTLSSRATT